MSLSLEKAKKKTGFPWFIRKILGRGAANTRTKDVVMADQVDFMRFVLRAFSPYFRQTGEFLFPL